MKTYTCDRCHRVIEYPTPVYQLKTISLHNTKHYHWQCLKDYLKDDQ